MSKEVGTGAKVKTPQNLGQGGNLVMHSSPPARSLRNRPPVDYRKLNEGKFNDEYSGDDFGSKQGEDDFQLYDDNDRDFDGDEYERNPWGTSHSKKPGYRGDDPLFNG